MKEADFGGLKTKGTRKLDDAVQAGGMHHYAAIDESKEIMRIDESLQLLSPLILPGVDKGVSLGGDTQQSLILIYHSLCDCSAKLIHSFDQVSKRVLSGHQFKDEDDGDALMDAPTSLESFLVTSRFKSHLRAVAVTCAMKLFLPFVRRNVV